MSKASLLGSGSSFAAAPPAGRRSARGRAKAITEGTIPAYELVRLSLDQVSPTPLNPRRNFGTDEQKAQFGEELRKAQLAACVVVTRTAYLALWPEHEAHIGSAEYVLCNGERRFRSAVHVDLEALDFVVRDEFAESRETFLNHLLKENLDRTDFDPIERANGVHQLVSVCAETREFGSQSRAAEQLGKSAGWITNQLLLLELPSEIQTMLSSNGLSGRDGVWLGRRLKDSPGLDAAGLLALLAEDKETKAQRKAEEKSILRAVAQGAAGTSPGEPLTAVKGAPGALPSQQTASSQPSSRSRSAGGGQEPLTAVKSQGVPEVSPDASSHSPAEPLTAVKSIEPLAPPVPAKTEGAADPQPSPDLRNYLGETAVEQARRLAQALTSDELVALVEALRTHL
ncbi:plasmid partitioning protein [Streptomyces mauvecolor]|uniref:Plasmid partitioning protein n=1 Tax=Streptomyces mauvecolor TaxID=58345 RepID=A0ABV9UF20_9ACTN